MSLFNKGEFKLSSGQMSNFKIDCDALTNYATTGPTLIVEDVLTTGGSINKYYEDGAIGI